MDYQRRLARNPGPMTLRLDKDTADALVADNVSAGAAINWLRYMEISPRGRGSTSIIWAC
jgi:hypothetical protein